MNSKKIILIVLLILSLLSSQVFAASAEVSINYVSKTLNSFTIAQGSKGGGTVLYISGVNFSPIAGDIQIYFGNYPCNLIAEGSTVSMVSCITTAAYDPNMQYSIPITMYTAGLLPVTCKSYVCLFSYQDVYTPFIYEVFPSTTVGNNLINIYGIHRISDVGDGRSPSASDLRYITIGDISCSTLDIIQSYLAYEDAIQCNTFLYQEAGEYNMTERVVYGDATYSLRAYLTSFFTGSPYIVRIVPIFQKNIVQSGGLNGHILTFTGTGFSSNPANLTSFTCKIGSVSCQVISNTQGSIQIQLPPYQAGYETAGKLPIDPSDTTQISPYLGSYGFRYTRYTRSSKSFENLILDLRTGTSTQSIIYDGYQTQLQSLFGAQNYDDYLRGYFFAPVDGSYTFETTVDDYIVVYMSTIQGTANPDNMQMLIRVNYHIPYSQDPYYTDNGPNVATVTLKKGYYYMEVIARDTYGSHYYYVSVSMPPFDISTISTKTIPAGTNKTLVNPTWKIENILIAPVNTLPEIITVTVDSSKFPNGTTTFTLYYYDNSNGELTKVSTPNIAIGATATQFKNAVAYLYQFTNYGISVTLVTLDSNGISTSTTADAVKYVYAISYQYIRPTSFKKLPETSFSNGVTVVSTQDHSPGMAGSYIFSINGLPLNVYDSSTGIKSTTIQITNPIGYIQLALRTYYNAPELRIIQRNVQQLPDQLSFNILYFGVISPQAVTIDVTALTGGTDNTFSTAITTKRDFAADRPYFSAIPYEFLRMSSPLPSIQISYNNMPAICIDCNYQYQSTSPLSISAAAFQAGNVGIDITITSTDPAVLTSYTLSDLIVTLYGQPCIIDAGASTTSSLKCTFNKISYLSTMIPQIPAGDEPPQVHIRQFGFITSTIKLRNQLTIASVSPLQLGMNGGVTVTVTGTGFPLSNNGQLSIQSDKQATMNQKVVISSVSNNQIQFSFTPASTGSSDHQSTLTYTINNLGGIYTYQDTTNLLSFQSSLDPTVTSLNIQSASPIMKQNIVVTGTNFDTVAANMKVYLYFASNLTKKYELGILSVDSSTSMTCVLGGGRTDDYYLRVLVVGKGMSAPAPANKLSYETVVNSISPATGSIGGGYKMTITGSNFATAKGSTQVFIGDGINSLCLITSITSKKIQCTVPVINSNYIVGDSKTVVVTARLIEDSICMGSCAFTYENTDTVYVQLVTTVSNDYVAGDTVTVSTNGSFDTSKTTVKVGSTSVILDSITTTSLTFKYPSLSAGSYGITVTVDGVNAYPILQSTTSLIIKSINSNAGSNKGQILSVAGNGFTSITDQSNVVLYNCSDAVMQLPIMSITRTNLTFEIPSNPEASCNINVTMGLTFQIFSYSQSSAFTPSVVVTDMGSMNYQIVTSNTKNKAIKFIVARYLNSDGGITTSAFPMDWTVTGTNQYTVTPSGAYLPVGTFLLDVSFETLGYASSTTNQFTIASTAISTITLAPVTASFGGQGSFTISSAGFITKNIQNNEIYVCGIKAKILTADQNGLTFRIPAFINANTHSTYGLGDEHLLNSQGNIISDTATKVNYAFDNNIKTYYDSNSVDCYLGLDFGAGAKGKITKIKYMPNAGWIRMNNYFEGAVFEGSDDNTAWTTILNVDPQLVHTGWNTWLPTSGTYTYRYVRFRQNNSTSLTKCQLSELQFYGIVYSTTPYSATLQCPLGINFFGGPLTFANVITYADSSTSVITSITPAFGPSTGNTVLTLAGTNFATPASLISIVIDGITCVVTSATSTQIKCQTGVRLAPPAEGNSFIAISNGNTIILDCQPYYYMDRWSSTATWGGEVPPRDGDTVYVPAGMTLLVDQSTPFINAIIVEGGRIVFSDETDMTLDANYFILIGGQFRAGLPTAPYQHKLTITLHGGYYDKQLPYFGNKVLGCMNCIFNMHGVVRTPTWSQITATVSPGDNQLTLLDVVDWQVGESIAIAATGFNHFESEDRIIVAVSIDKKTLTVDKPFVYRHFSGTESHGGRSFIMNAEVGLLTRNIVIQGDDMTDTFNHGSHLIFMGKVANGLDATLSYTEIRKCGQPKIIARYCSHFHLAGEVPNSFVRGIAVHHSHARVLTIHGTHYLTVEKNVGYLVQGHNIFIEDGIETYNIIQNNLMISTIASQTMLQSDTSPASYWITNPLNTVINNHAAGGDFYGFWYQIKANPDGPSATPSICPTGMKLGLSSNNVAHSNRRFGLRIFNYAARKYPCLSITDESLVNPFDFNPAYESIFDNYLLWKNQENGLLGEQLGYVTISNFLIIDSGVSGMQFYVANITYQNVTAKKSVIVGYSSGNAPSDMSILDNGRGIITPRTDGFRADDITFVNFGPNMTPLQSCSKCESILFQVTGGKTSFFNNIKYSNIQGNYIYWNNWRREIFIDQDGTLTQPIRTQLSIASGNYGTVTAYFDHLNIPNHCYNIIPKWDNSTFCDQTITLRSLLYTNADPFEDFVGQTIRTYKLNQFNDSNEPASYDVQPMIIIKKSHDIPGSWAFPYAVGYSYHTHFQLGIDFLHLSLAPSQYWQEKQAIIVRFNHTDQRELYNISRYSSQKLQRPLINESTTMIDINTCLNGDYYHDQSARHLFVCVTGRNKTVREFIDIVGIRCLNFCPKSNPFGPREAFTRKWSNATQWPNQTLPIAGDNVTIPYQWNLVLDVNPPIFNYVLINGILYFDMMDLTFQAHTIWVQLGIIYIGSESKPHPYKATFVLHGNKNDNFTVLDASASGNKMLAVTGGLEFYGTVPSVVWTRLTAIAPANTNTITVQDLTGWNVGDEIVIGATYSGQSEDEVFKIVSITGNTITLDGNLVYEHYGDLNVVKNGFNGTIDTRAAVGLLTRNIKITRGPDPDNWGCRVQVYSYVVQFINASQPATAVNGYVIFDGVQLNGCGQYGASNAGLRIQNIGKTVENLTPTIVSRSVVRNCNGMCAYITDSTNITIDNNIFHFGLRYLVIVFRVKHYAFINNVLLGLRIRPQVKAQSAGTGMAPNNAAYEQFQPIKDIDNVTVTNNLVQGSQDNGFVFPFTPCSKIDTYHFKGNTAGSCFAAFVINVYPGELCIAASGFSGYASYIGLIANPPGVVIQVQYFNMFFTDNQRGFTLRFAHQIDDNTIKLSDSYFMGYSRPSCPSCYSDKKLSYCNNGYAIRMFTATLSGETFPFNKNISGFDVICTQQAFDAKAFLTNVTFQNYKFGNNTVVPYCTGMNVFRKHDLASDATAVHNLYKSPCINCDLSALVYFSPSNPDWAGWAGGCGELDCTGSINYFIHDHDGYFTKALNNNTLQPTQLLANNQPIGGNETACQKVNDWNGYWCKFEELALLEYQSIAADFNKRMVWPLYLKYDGGLWNSTTNGWREWAWIAPGDPAQLRLARFWSVVRLSKIYNMTYSSQPPSDAVYQIQKRQLPSGNPNDWVIIKIYFPVPNVVIVRVKNTTGQSIMVPGFQQINGTYPDLALYTNVCGANYYKFQTNVIYFVVNGINNCQVRLTLSSYVQLTVRFQIQMTQFYSNNGPTSVLTNIIAFLNIDPSQIKIVGINPGSTILIINLLPPSINNPVNISSNSTDNNTALLVNEPRDSVKDHNDLNGMVNQLISGLKSNDLDLGYDILNISSTIKIISTESTPITICPKTYLYNQTTNICYCSAGYIQLNNTCIGCETLPYAINETDINNTRRCQCKPTFIWSDNLKRCVCPGAKNIVDTNTACFDCSNITNGAGAIDKNNTNMCKCIPSYQFFTNNNTCNCPDFFSYIDKKICYGCSNFGNGTGKVSNVSKNCECLPTYIYTSGKCLCPARYYVSLNNTCVQCINNNCTCPAGQIFKAFKMACGCPYEKSAYVGKTCYSCNSSNSTGDVNANGTGCVCLSNFVWKDKMCQCPDKISIVLNGTCYSCSGTTGNKSGKGVVSGNECSCKDQYTWVPQLRTCVCGVNAMYVNGTCYLCKQFANTVASNNSQIASCICANNLLFHPKKFVCYCESNNSIIKQQACVDCTSSTIMGIKKTNTTTCTCSSTLNLEWSSRSQTCICKAGYIINGTKCIKCSNITYSTPNSVSGISCSCNPTFVWSATTLSCGCDSNSVLSPIVSKKQTCVNCDMFVGSDGIDPYDTIKCHCLGSLVWDSFKKVCLCSVSSNSTNSTNATNSTNSTNSSTTVHVIIGSDATCILCNNATDPNIVNPPVDAYNCKCADPYFWDNLQMKCIKCTSIPNGESKKKGNQLICNCKTGYYFDIYTNQCQKTPKTDCSATNITNCLNCTLIPFSDPTAGPFPLDPTESLSAKDNSLITTQYSSISSSLKKYKNYQCPCAGGYYWQPSRKRCFMVFK